MDKRIVFALLAALLLGVGWLCWPRDDAPLVTQANAGSQATDAHAAAAALPESAAAAASDTRAERTAAAAAAPTAGTETDAEPTGELLVRVTWADGEKATGIRVYLARTVPGASRPLAELVSDAAGEARAHVAAGKVVVSSDRGRLEKELIADVVAGQRQEVVLTLAEGVQVVGVVRDGAGAPVPGAHIWLTSYQSPWCAGAFVADTDAQGAFALRAVPKGESLGAVAVGYAPSKLVDLDLLDTSKSLVHVDLVLSDAGGALAGRVVDEQGQAVAGAIVAVGSAKRAVEMRSSGTMEERWAPRRGVSDADGRYEMEGLQPGGHPVEVLTAEFEIWRGECTIEAKATAQLDIRLLRGVTVHGVVTGEDGEPLAGALVRAFPIAIAETFLQVGQYDFEGTFRYPFVAADAAGRYRLRHAASGELHLYASPGGRRKLADVALWASEVLRAQSGAVLEWNPKLDPGPTIRGVVRFADGVPMPGASISIVEPGKSMRRYGRADTQGRFRFVRLERKAYDVSVQLDQAPRDAPPMAARDVWPDSGELELRAAFVAPKVEAKASVRGVVSDAAGRLSNPTALLVVLSSMEEGQWHSPQLEGGAFRFDGVKPGRKQLVVLSGEDPILFGPWFELQPAEDKDLGTVVTEPGGKLRLSIVRQPGTESLEPDVWIMPVGGPRARRVKSGRATELLIDNLCVGEQQVSALAEGLTSARGKCTIVAGAEVSATIELRAAVAREFVVEYAATQRVVRVRLQDEQGGEVFDHDPSGLDRPYRRKYPLPIGRFTLLVETEGGGKAQLEFEMTSLAAGQPPVVLQAK